MEPKVFDTVRKEVAITLKDSRRSTSTRYILREFDGVARDEYLKDILADVDLNVAAGTEDGAAGVKGLNVYRSWRSRFQRDYSTISCQSDRRHLRNMPRDERTWRKS